MERTARFLIRHWTRLLLLLLPLLALAGWRAVRLEFDFSFRHLFLAEPEDAVAATLAEQFTDDAGSYLVAVLRGPDVLAPAMLAAVADASDAVAALPNVAKVYSLATIPYIRGRGDELSLEPITRLVAGGDVDLAALRAEVLASPLYVRRLVSADGRTTALLALLDSTHRNVTARAPTVAAFRETVTAKMPPGVEVHFTGYPVAEAVYADMLLNGFGAAQAAGVLLMAITLFVMFRSWTAVVLPLAAVGLSTVLVLGVMEVIGQKLTFTNASVPLIMLILGVAETSFFVARFHEEAAERWDDETAVRAVASTLWPGFVAAATTSAGFFALGSGHIGLTRDFGFNMSAASLVTFAVSALVIPGALARAGRPPAAALAAVTGGPVTRVLERLGRWVVGRPWTVAIGSLAVIAFGVVCGRWIVLDTLATGELRADHPVNVAQRAVDGALSGAFQTHVVLRARDGGSITTPDRLRQIEALEAFLAEQPGVIKAWSVADYVKEMNVAMRGGRPEDRRLPDSKALVAQYLLLLDSSSVSDLSTLVDPSEQTASITLGTTDLGTDVLRDIRRRTDAFVRDRLGDAFELRFTGDYWEIARGNEVIVGDQLRSVLGSFVLIFVLVGIFLRSWRLTLLCLPPNIIPLLAGLGFMGAAGIALRVGTSIILPAALGIAVDTTTHYLTRVREEWERDRDYPAAVQRALVGTGWGIVSSTLVLVVGFLAYWVPPFLAFNQVGMLTSITLVVALVANLFLTPMLVLWTKPFGTGSAARPRAGAPRPDRLTAAS